MLISKITVDKSNSPLIMAKAGLAKIQNYSYTKLPSGDLQWLLTPKQMKDKR